MQAAETFKKPVLILICGLVGTGKSTIACALAERTGFNVIRSDEVRKELAGLDTKEHRYESFCEGIYSEEFFELTYNTLFGKASTLLEKGEGVILDASFKKERYRLRGRELARKFEYAFLLIECTCSDKQVKQRLEKRVLEGKDASDGRWEVFARQKSDFEEITGTNRSEHLVINTEKAMEDNLQEIEGAIASM